MPGGCAARDGVPPSEIVVVDTDSLMGEVTAHGSHDCERLHDTGIGRGEPQLGLPPAARKLSTARWSRSSAAPYDVKSPVR